MRWLKIFLEIELLVLVILSVIAYATHNVADAIWFMVVAIYFRNVLIKVEQDKTQSISIKLKVNE